MTREPSPVVRVAVEHYPSTPAAVPDARARTAALLRGWSLDPSALDTARLVVSELASNAVKASPPGEPVAVRLTAADGALLIEVWDGGTGRPILTTPDDEEEGGRGLLFVAGLCDQTGWYACTSGKAVWARLPAPLPPSGGGHDHQTPMSRRIPAPVPDAVVPVSFTDDPKLLRRIADGLRALDDWHLPAPPSQAARPHHHAVGGATR